MYISSRAHLPSYTEPQPKTTTINNENNLVALHGVATQSSIWQADNVMKQLHYAT